MPANLGQTVAKVLWIWKQAVAKPFANSLPKYAPLNWLSDQLALFATAADSDPSVSIIEGQERFLAR